MRRRVALIIAMCCAAVGIAPFVLSGCVMPTDAGASLVEPGLPRQVDARAPAVDTLADAIDAFGVDLLRATTTRDVTGNVIVSPASVHAALSMTVNGANDETAKEMRAVLRTEAMGPESANAQWASLLVDLDRRSSAQTLEIANSLWARKGIAFKKPFLDADRDFFGAKVTTLDYQKDDVPGAINSWVSKSTHGMITRMVDRVPLNAVLYLANAVYFKGDWVTPFRHEGTRTQPFTHADGSKTDVDMMHASVYGPYVENGTLQATRLPYKGGDTAFYVLLPKPGVGLGAAMASLSGSGFSDLRRTMLSETATDVVLGLPKLDTDFGTSLKKQLAAMGMSRAFDVERAQFTDMADPGPLAPIYIGDVMHKTRVKVDEKGTEAAAATVVEMVAGSAASFSEPPTIICDRPYLFAIVDEHSGAMLFLGAVNDPSR